jgi:hypothetical protein
MLGWNLALGHIREFACVVKVLAPLAPTLVFSKMVHVASFALIGHKLLLLESLLDFQFDSNLELSMDPFRANFLHMFHLSANGVFGMVFEHLRNSFDLEDLVSGFIQLH